ncbi:MAG: fibronectin type III domain-containing protein [bacterium]|nr:fibronectin type III domain-containing protein [bacterium]
MINNITIQTIRAGMVLGIAFFALVNTAFAAPTLTPVSVTQIRDTSENLVSYVSNQNKNSVVWFEITGGSFQGTPLVVGMRSVYENGFFQWQLQNLSPGTTYYYRAVATEGGMTAYSQGGSFTTETGVSSVPTATSYQSGSSSGANNGSGKQTPAPKVAQATTQKPAVKKVAVAPTETKEGFTNGNSAAVIGVGDGVFPSTLVGWIALLVALLVVAIMAQMIYEAPEKRRKKREEEEKQILRDQIMNEDKLQ